MHDVGETEIEAVLSRPPASKGARDCESPTDRTWTLVHPNRLRCGKFSIGQLRKRHGAKLLGAGVSAHTTVAIVTIHDTMKCLPRQNIHELSKEILPMFVDGPHDDDDAGNRFYPPNSAKRS